MRVVRGVLLGVVLLPFAGALAGCDTLDTLQFWDTKKKLPGVRQEVFPGGVPGVEQGIPPELVKGYQAPQEPTADPAVVAAQAADKVDPKETAKPKPRPKPKVAKVSHPKPPRQAAPQQAAPQQPPVRQAQAPAQQAAPQQPASAPWPGQQTQQPPAQAAWPGGAQPQSQPQAQEPAAWPGSH
jgi:hypothetical protein